jgi:leucyl aminopeptidase
MEDISEYTFVENDKPITEKKSKYIYFNTNDELSLDEFYEKLWKIAKKNHLKCRLNLDFVSDEYKRIIVESFIIGAYTYKDLNRLKNVFVGNRTILDESPLAYIITQCMSIIDTPPNKMNSIILDKFVREHADKNISIETFEEDRIAAEGLNGILAVNQGSINPAKMIILRYSHPSDIKEDPVVLVGKGVIFDSGGLNIKHGDFKNMKCDKAGAVYVYGLIQALAVNKARGNFIGFMPLVENMPSNNAVHPGDIISTCNGKTIEISNTDAEGRIILADALCWVRKNISSPKMIIDMATLTGQAVSIFGGLGTALISNKAGEQISKELMNIGDKYREFYWILPIHRQFRAMLESDVADYISYNPTSNADTILAGVFLNEFVDPKVPWIHLDIAGVAYKDNATGEPMRSLYYFLLNQTQKN